MWEIISLYCRGESQARLIELYVVLDVIDDTISAHYVKEIVSGRVMNTVNLIEIPHKRN